MILKQIIRLKKNFNAHYSKLSAKTRKEVLRFIFAFIFAWIAKTIINELPLINQYLLITKLDIYIQQVLIQLTSFFLSLLKYPVYTEGKFIQIIGTPGIRYEIGCLGFRHITLFVFFIIAYLGKLSNKIWYIPIGIIILTCINALRGTIICISQKYYPTHTAQIHDLISPIFMYLTILLLWIIWVIKFGEKPMNKKKDANN